MPQKLPRISGIELIKFLTKLSYSIVRRRGSHVRLIKNNPNGVHKITVPAHKELAKGTLNSILTDVALRNNISKEKLIQML